MQPSNRFDRASKADTTTIVKNINPPKTYTKTPNVSFKNEITPQKKVQTRIIDLEKTVRSQKTVKKQESTVWIKIQETHSSILAKPEQEITKLEKEIFVQKLLDNCSSANSENISATLNSIENSILIRLDLIEKIRKMISVKIPEFNMAELQLIPNFSSIYNTFQEKIDYDLAQLNTMINSLHKLSEEALEYCLKQSILCSTPLNCTVITEWSNIYNKAQEESVQELFSSLKFYDEDTRTWFTSLINILKQQRLKQLKTIIGFLLNTQQNLCSEYKNVYLIIISEMYNALKGQYHFEVDIENLNEAIFINTAKNSLELSIKKYKKARFIIEENLETINLHKIPIEYIEPCAMANFKIIKSSFEILKNNQSSVCKSILEQLKLINTVYSAETIEALKNLRIILDEDANQLEQLQNLVLKIANNFLLSAQQLSSFYIIKSGTSEYKLLTIASNSKYLSNCKLIAAEKMKLFPKSNGITESEYLAVLKVLNLENQYLACQSIQNAIVFDDNLVNLLLSLDSTSKTFSISLQKQFNTVERSLIRIGYSLELLNTSATTIKAYSNNQSLAESLIQYSSLFNSLYHNYDNLSHEHWVESVEAKTKALNRIYYDQIAELYFPSNEKFSVLTDLFNLINNAQIHYTNSWQIQLTKFTTFFRYKLLLAESKIILQEIRSIILTISSAEDKVRDISSKYYPLVTARTNLDFFENMIKEIKNELMENSSDNQIIVKLDSAIKDCSKVINRSQAMLANN